MKATLMLGTAILAALAASASGRAETLYTGPDGAGMACTQAEPCNLLAARNFARRLIPKMTQDLIISLAPGVYHLDRTFVLTPADSGANGFSVIYRSQVDHAAQLSGGYAVKDWKPEGGGVFEAQLSAGLRFRQFYVGGMREVRARTPNGGPATDLDWNRQDMTVSFGQSLRDVRDLRGVELVATRHWQQHRLHLVAVAPGADGRQIVTLDPAEAVVSFNAMGDTLGDDQPYYLENARAFLDQPGEWYYDEDSHILHYMPRHGERLGEAVVPGVQTLVLLEGYRDHPVHNVAFEGLTFEYAGWNGPSDNGFVQVQATWQATLDGFGYMPAAVEVRGVGAHHLRFSDNIIEHFGADGIDFYKGTSDNAIIGNLVTDGSGQGIAIDADPSRFDWNGPGSSRITVANNRVNHVGIDYSGSVGIMAGYVNGARIEHNEVSDLPYTGISVGWGWTLAVNPSGNNLVRANDIHDVMQHHDDGAAIYLLSRQPGTIVSENYIHGVRRSALAGDHPVAGIYLDNGSSYITVRNNVITDVSKRININGDDRPALGIMPARDNHVSDDDKSDPQIIAAAGTEKKTK
jgi:hypothetical protein